MQVIHFKSKIILLIVILVWLFIELAVVLKNYIIFRVREELAIPGLNVVNRTSDIYESGFTWKESPLCPRKGDDLEVFIFVLSAPVNNVSRMAIRQTWGSYKPKSGISLGFLIGTSDNSTINEAVIAENKIYKDMIVATFLDNYNNLTLKTISLLEWTHKKCHKAKFILKIDDDVYLSVKNLRKLMDKHANDKWKIYGNVLEQSIPYRDATSKYYVGVTEYEKSLYPQYVVGPAYMLTSDIAHDLFIRALEAPYFRFEDVHITGFLASQLLNVDLIDVPGFHFISQRKLLKDPCWIKDQMITYHKILAKEMSWVYKMEIDYKNYKCSFF